MNNKETENELEQIEDNLFDKTSFPITIGMLNKEAISQFRCEGYCITIYFNDMFGWAYSYCMSFIPQKNNTIEELLEEFNTWWDMEGIEFKNKFDKVEYPSEKNGTYNSESIEIFFKSNLLIGKDMQKSINDFCKREIDIDLQNEEHLPKK